MYDFQDVKELGRDLDPVQPPQWLRQRVLDGLGSTVVVSAEPRRARRTWRLGLLAGAVAAAIVAAGVVVAGTVNPHKAPVMVNAAAFLSSAADTVRSEAAKPVRGDQFVYVESVTTTSARNEGTGATSVVTARRQVWQSVDGSRDGSVLVTRKPDGQVQQTRLPGCRDGKETATKGDVTVEQACTAHRAYRDDLPTDADAMLAYLYRAGAGNRNPRDQQAFTAGVDLIRETAMPPASLAAVFDALARIPSVTLVGDVADSAGRPGIAVAITEAQQSRAELIFDRQGHTLLGERVTAIGDGQILEGTALLKIVIVDRVGVTA